MRNVIVRAGWALVLTGLLAGCGTDAGVSASKMATEPVDLGEILDDPRELVRLATPVVKGNADAPITVMEFADYQCPSCRTFALTHKPLIDQGYVDNGNVKFAFYDFPLVSIHDHAFLAARAGRCAEDQGAFWEYHDAIFRNQSSWAAQGNPAGDFIDLAEEVGLDRDAFAGCLRSDRHAEMVTAQMRLAEQLAVGGTPTIMITLGNGMANRLSTFDAGTISQALDEALATLQGGEEGS